MAACKNRPILLTVSNFSTAIHSIIYVTKMSIMTAQLPVIKYLNGSFTLTEIDCDTCPMVLSM